MARACSLDLVTGPLELFVEGEARELERREASAGNSSSSSRSRRER